MRTNSLTSAGKRNMMMKNLLFFSHNQNKILEVERIFNHKVVKIHNQYLIAVPLTLTINIEPVSPNVP